MKRLQQNALSSSCRRSWKRPAVLRSPKIRTHSLRHTCMRRRTLARVRDAHRCVRTAGSVSMTNLYSTSFRKQYRRRRRLAPVLDGHIFVLVSIWVLRWKITSRRSHSRLLAMSMTHQSGEAGASTHSLMRMHAFINTPYGCDSAVVAFRDSCILRRFASLRRKEADVPLPSPRVTSSSTEVSTSDHPS